MVVVVVVVVVVVARWTITLCLSSHHSLSDTHHSLPLLLCPRQAKGAGHEVTSGGQAAEEQQPVSEARKHEMAELLCSDECAPHMEGELSSLGGRPSPVFLGEGLD